MSSIHATEAGYASYGLTLLQDGDKVFTKNLFRLHEGAQEIGTKDEGEKEEQDCSISSSAGPSSSSTSSGSKHLCLLLGLPEDLTEQSLVGFLDPYINEINNFALYSQYQYFEVDTQIYGKFKPLMSAVVELKSKDAKESFVGVYNNLIAPSTEGNDGAVPLLALSLSWVVMHDDEVYLKEKNLYGFEKRGYAREADPQAIQPGLPNALPTCGTCLSRVNGQLSGLFDSEIDSSLVSLRMSHSRRRCRTCLVGHEYLRLHQAPMSLMPPSSSSSVTAKKRIWRCFGSLDTSESVLTHSMCGLHENIWVCLICSYTGCGRYSNQHAKAHYMDTGHACTVELVTGRIWSYHHDTFVHVDGSLSSVFGGYRYMQESDPEESNDSDSDSDSDSVGEDGLHEGNEGQYQGSSDPSAGIGASAEGETGFNIRSRFGLPKMTRTAMEPFPASSSPSSAQWRHTVDDSNGGGGVRSPGGRRGRAKRERQGGSSSWSRTLSYHPDYSGQHLQRHGRGQGGGGGGGGDAAGGASLDVLKPPPYAYTHHNDGGVAGMGITSEYGLGMHAPSNLRASTIGGGDAVGRGKQYQQHQDRIAQGVLSQSTSEDSDGLTSFAFPAAGAAAGGGGVGAARAPGTLDDRTLAKLISVKTDYDLLKDSRLVEQDLHLEKMLAQEMARALHYQYHRDGGEEQGDDTDADGDDAQEEEDEDEEEVYSNLEAANREMSGRRESSIGGTGLGAYVNTTSSHEAAYLNEEVERDLCLMEGIKIEVSIQEQELLSIEQQHFETVREAQAMKSANNAVMARIKQLKEREAELREQQQRLLEAGREREHELNQTRSDLLFYLRSRDTLANLPAEEVSQREVRTGSVSIVSRGDGGSAISGSRGGSGRR